MHKGLEGIKVIEVGGAFAMPLVGMLMGSWGAEVIHVEPPGRGDNQRHLLASGMAGWARPCQTNYLWEHVGRNKMSITVNLGTVEGQSIIHRLCAGAKILIRPVAQQPSGMTVLFHDFFFWHVHCSKIPSGKWND